MGPCERCVDLVPEGHPDEWLDRPNGQGHSSDRPRRQRPKLPWELEMLEACRLSSSGAAARRTSARSRFATLRGLGRDLVPKKADC